MEAIAQGKHVVTANKALLAKHGNEIFAAAHAKGVMVTFEAAVAGSIPIIKAIREGLTATRIQWLAGFLKHRKSVVSGTSWSVRVDCGGRCIIKKKSDSNTITSAKSV